MRRVHARSDSRCRSATTQSQHPVRQSRGGPRRKIALYCASARHQLPRRCASTASRVGNALIALGLSRGQRVLLLMHDTPEYVAAIFGAMRAGFVPVLVNTLSPPELVAYYLAGQRCRGGDRPTPSSRHCSRTKTARASRLRHVVLTGEAEPQTWRRIHTVCTHGTSGSPRSPTTWSPRTRTGTQMAFWMYSSGSTGRPKGVVHLQHDAAVHVRELRPAHARHSRGRHRVLAAQDFLCVRLRQLAHVSVFGRRAARCCIRAGRTPKRCLAAIERHRPTILFGLPTLYNALLAHPGSERRDLSSLRLCVSAAEVLSSEMFREWQRRYGLSIVEGLGSTEVLHMYLSNRVDQQKPGASGARVPGYEIKLTDIDGNPVQRGESGVMWVRGRLFGARCTGTGPTRRGRRCARAGSGPATASTKTRTASTTSRAVPTIWSR